jgi:lipopolysaccharide transport system ATP-binding protein
MGVIVAEGLGKQFTRHHDTRPRSFKELFLKGPSGLAPAERFWALKDVAFSVAQGEALGLIGHNGAGKSTLLQLLCGIVPADEGRLSVSGHVSGLLELGTGFHPDLSGRENVYINGIIAGLTRREVEARFDDIVAFAELEHVIDSPLRTYSSGMKMRLGFAVAVHTEPDVLLIDEVLAVGDMAFQNKCLERIEAIRASGVTIVLVSHDLHQITRFCDKALWLRGGRVAGYGSAEAVVNAYKAEMANATRKRTPSDVPDRVTPSGAVLRVNETRFGSLEMEITSVCFRDARNQPLNAIEGGEPLAVEIGYRAPAPIPEPIFGLSITDPDGNVFLDVNTLTDGYSLPELSGEGVIVVRFERLDLSGGRYFVNVGVYERQWAFAYDYHWHVYPLDVDASQSKGVLLPPRCWQLEPHASAVGPERAIISWSKS